MTYLETPELRQIWIYPDNSAIQLWYHVSYDIITMVITYLQSNNPVDTPHPIFGTLKWHFSYPASSTLYLFSNILQEINTNPTNLTEIEYLNMRFIFWKNGESEKITNSYFHLDSNYYKKHLDYSQHGLSFFEHKSDQFLYNLLNTNITKEDIKNIIIAILENSKSSEILSLTGQLKESFREDYVITRYIYIKSFNNSLSISQKNVKIQKNKQEIIMGETLKEYQDKYKVDFKNKKYLYYSGQQFDQDLETISKLLKVK